MEREKLIRLVTAAQSGDGDALGELLGAFYKDVFYFALKTVKDEELAADITQEAFAEVIATIGDLKEPAAFVKWLKQITYHQCTRYFKKKKDVLVDEDEEGNTVFDIVAEERTEFIPDEAMERQDFRRTILLMLDELSEEQRAAVMMYYYDELSIKQIAEIQGVSEGTVKSRLNYARKAIKNSVETYEKKHNIRLHTFAFLPFMYWLLKRDAEESAPSAVAAAPKVAEGVSAATGQTISLASAVPVSSGPVTTAATVSGTGLMSKLAATPMVTKIIAGVVVTAMVVGGLLVALQNNDDADHPAIPTTSASQPSFTINTEGSQPNAYVVPDGCTYITEEETYSAGQNVPVNATIGDQYITPDYVYTCFAGEDGLLGWVAKVSNQGKTSYAALLEGINGLPLISLEGTFSGCGNLETAPQIPETVTNLVNAFANCFNLSGTISIASQANSYEGCFANTALPITLTGNSDLLTEIADTGNNKNVVAQIVLNGNIIPNDCQYVLTDGTVLEPGSIMPSVAAKGDRFVTPYYNYTFITDDSGSEGWGVKTTDRYRTHYPELFSEINQNLLISLEQAFYGCSEIKHAPDMPDTVTNVIQAFGGCKKLEVVPKLPKGITDLSDTFYNCAQLREAPEIPKGVERLNRTFYGCSSLKKAPVIPDTVSSMDYTFTNCVSLESATTIPESVISLKSTFSGCSSLTGIIEINADPVWNLELYYADCFKGTIKEIILTGTCDVLEELAATSTNGNVSVETP